MHVVAKHNVWVNGAALECKGVDYERDHHHNHSATLLLHFERYVCDSKHIGWNGAFEECIAIWRLSCDLKSHLISISSWLLWCFFSLHVYHSVSRFFTLNKMYYKYTHCTCTLLIWFCKFFLLFFEWISNYHNYFSIIDLIVSFDSIRFDLFDLNGWKRKENNAI